MSVVSYRRETSLIRLVLLIFRSDLFPSQGYIHGPRFLRGSKRLPMRTTLTEIYDIIPFGMPSITPLTLSFPFKISNTVTSAFTSLRNQFRISTATRLSTPCPAIVSSSRTSSTFNASSQPNFCLNAIKMTNSSWALSWPAAAICDSTDWVWSCDSFWEVPAKVAPTWENRAS